MSSKWLWRGLLFSALLAWPCKMIAPYYQSLLLTLLGAVLGIDLDVHAGGSVDLSSANALGLYVAMCLAAERVPPVRRLRALVLGILGMVVAEVAVASLGIMIGAGLSSDSTLGRIVAQVLELSRWLIAPLLWILLLQPFEASPGTMPTRDRLPVNPPARAQR